MAGYYRAPIYAPGQQFLDQNGVPYAGGFLWQYLAGTVTPQTTFTDNTAGIPNANPITLDAAGRVPSNVDIWFSGGVAYKFELRSAAGVVVDTKDNLQGLNDPAFAAGNFSEWVDGPTLTFISGTSASAVGDQRSILETNRRIQATCSSVTTYGRITSTVFAAGLTTIVIVWDSGNLTNPIDGGCKCGLLDSVNISIPSAALVLGIPRNKSRDFVNTLLYGPIGSNMAAATTPPDIVASAGGAGNQVVTGVVNGVAGSLTFNKTTHGRATGEAVQLTTSNTLPGGTALATTYIVFVVDANNFGLYAVPNGWDFEQPLLDPVTVPGGLTWGNPLAFVNAGVGNQTVTPGFVAPTGVTRVFAQVTGGGGGGGGAASNAGQCAGGGGGGSAGTALGWLPVTPGTWYAATVGGGGAGGAAGNNNGVAGGNSTFSY